MEDALIILLRDRLKKTLPGMEVQYLMAPSSRSNNLYDFPENRISKLSSVMILLFREDERWKFPLIQRPEYNGVHSGQMALPGGGMEGHDRDRIETALRETKEETGMDTERSEIIGTLTELHVQASRNNVLPVVGYFPGIPVFDPDPVEVQSLHIVTLDDLLDEKNKKRTTIKVRGDIRIEAPYYDVDGKIVWGATAMILSEFLYIVSEIKNDSPV